jgi:hypothetical protein
MTTHSSVIPTIESVIPTEVEESQFRSLDYASTTLGMTFIPLRMTDPSTPLGMTAKGGHAG